MNFFAGCFAETRGKHAEAVTELLIKPNSFTSPPPFCLTRIDIIYGSPDAPHIERVAEKPLSDATQRRYVLASGLSLDVAGMGWEEFNIAFTNSAFEIGRLGVWLEKWLDTSESHDANAQGLSGVVHALAWSHEEPDIWRLTVDFGSAPLEALHEFLACLSNCGVTQVVVLSPRDDEHQ